MIYLVLGGLVIGLAVWVYRRSPGVQRGRWRVGSGLAASVLLAVSGFLAVRGQYIASAVAGGLALSLAIAARTQRGARPKPPPAAGRLSLEEARSILGVDADAGPEEVQAAYLRLMRLAHPDKGGTTGLASQLNAARERLLKG